MSLMLAITGGIACGKSTVGSLLTSEGFVVLDTDHVGHDVIRKNQPAYHDLLATFGRKICDSQGEIDRKALARIVFDDPAKREQLNRLVHPRIRTAWTSWMDDRRSQNEDAAVQIPLLFEVGAHTESWDAIICITAPADQVLVRLMERGLDTKEARLRIDAQLPVEEKAGRSDYVICNDGDLTNLKQQTLQILKRIRQQETP